MQGLKMVLNMIDLTTLEGKDTPGKVKQMCYKAQHLHDSYPDLPTVAAVCVYPSMVGVARKELKDSMVKIASVSTAFPIGLGFSKIDAICVFANVFLKAQTKGNVERMRKIMEYIQKFENQEFAKRN